MEQKPKPVVSKMYDFTKNGQAMWLKLDWRDKICKGNKLVICCVRLKNDESNYFFLTTDLMKEESISHLSSASSQSSWAKVLLPSIFDFLSTISKKVISKQLGN